jgi:predicted nucleic acid-binding protein
LPTISNTSPLIWLAKVGKLSLLKDLFGEVIITQESYREAVEEGLKAGFRDAVVIKDACERGWIKVTPLSEKQMVVCEKVLQQSFELHAGEVHAIVLAREFGKDALLLMDDSCGRAFAETWGLKVRGVLYVVIAALRKGLLSDAEAKEAVLSLVQRGFRIEPKLLARVLAELGR